MYEWILMFYFFQKSPFLSCALGIFVRQNNTEEHNKKVKFEKIPASIGVIEITGKRRE